MPGGRRTQHGQNGGRVLGGDRGCRVSESLDDLQERDVVDRTVIDDKPVRVEYSLTEWGERLEPVVTAMDEWGQRYLERAGDDAEE